MLIRSCLLGQIKNSLRFDFFLLSLDFNQRNILILPDERGPRVGATHQMFWQQIFEVTFEHKCEYVRSPMLNAGLVLGANELHIV